MAQRPKDIVEYGFANRRVKFAEKYIVFLQSNDNIKMAVDGVLKAAGTKTKRQQVIWGLTRLAFEDEFQSMILGCANGYSYFAKPLRALFEKVVTLLYLIKNPKDAKLYLKYHHILHYGGRMTYPPWSIQKYSYDGSFPLPQSPRKCKRLFQGEDRRSDNGTTYR